MSERRTPPDPADDATDYGGFVARKPRGGKAEGAIPDDSLPLPERVGRYRVLEVLGEGGMGTVYLAEESEPIERKVAVKVVRATRFDRQLAHRFEAERRMLARMSHPAIAQVYEAGDLVTGEPYFAMEHVPGLPITTYCDRERLPLDRRLELFVAVCGGIQHAHQKGILHRDIKPGNILVATEQGNPVPKIIDFGVAKALDQPLGEGAVTEYGVVVGTPSYLSPEAVASGDEGGDPDTRTDVFALGVLLFELLVGERPFAKPGDSLLQVLREVGERTVPAPSARFRSLDAAKREELAAQRGTTPAALARALAGDLDAITLKATAHDREKRYPSAAELAADVERHRALVPVVARPPGRIYSLGRLVRRHRAAAVGAALVVLALAGGVVARTLEARRANREAVAARRAEAEAKQVVDFLIDLFKVSDPGVSRGETITARELLDRGAQKIRAQLVDQPLVRARLLDTMGLVYRQLELSKPAKPLLEEALAIRERELGQTAGEVGASLNHLGNLYWIDGDYARAEVTLRRALAILEKEHGENSLAVADALDNLGSVFEIQARFAEAQPVFERALAIREAELGPDDLQVSASLDDLGVSLLDQGQPERAEPLLRRALAIREKQLGPDDPWVAVAVNGVGIALYQQGKKEESLAMNERALAIREKVFGADSAAVAQSLNNLSNLYLDLGREADAERVLQRASAIWTKVLGEDHPRHGIVLFNLGDLYLSRGTREGAERAAPLLERVVAIFEKAYGDEHPRTALALKRLADDRRALGRNADAIGLCRRALAIQEKAEPQGDDTKKTRADCEAWESGTPSGG